MRRALSSAPEPWVLRGLFDGRASRGAAVAPRTAALHVDRFAAQLHGLPTTEIVAATTTLQSMPHIDRPELPKAQPLAQLSPGPGLVALVDPLLVS